MAYLDALLQAHEALAWQYEQEAAGLGDFSAWEERPEVESMEEIPDFWRRFLAADRPNRMDQEAQTDWPNKTDRVTGAGRAMGEDWAAEADRMVKMAQAAETDLPNQAGWETRAERAAEADREAASRPLEQWDKALRQAVEAGRWAGPVPPSGSAEGAGSYWSAAGGRQTPERLRGPDAAHTTAMAEISRFFERDARRYDG